MAEGGEGSTGVELYGTPVQAETTPLTKREADDARFAGLEQEISNRLQDAAHRTEGPDGKMVVDKGKVADLIRNQNAPNPIKQSGS